MLRLFPFHLTRDGHTRMPAPSTALLAIVLVFMLASAGCNWSGGTVAPPDGVRFKIEIPDGLGGEEHIYVAGTFNDWNPGHRAYRLKKENGETYTITLPDVSSGEHEFKFTLGSWERVEVDQSGADVGNRMIMVPEEGGVTYASEIYGWRPADQSWPFPNSTATSSVSVLDPAFSMDPLDRTRRVWIYLPPDYKRSERAYPVLYMHDGQNLFDDATSYAGEWGVDETLDSLHATGDPGVIVVGIDNGGASRADEYSPWRNERLGSGGEGDAYVQFLTETLKPHIDSLYRTQPGPATTGVMGSSMGGLISLYAVAQAPDVFGIAGVFSPAFRFASEIFTEAEGMAPRPFTRIYMMTGALESAEGERDNVYVEDHERMVATLTEAGFEQGEHLRELVREDGRHAEWFWRREFAAAYPWMF